jgi:hypothetical protein
MLRRIAAASAVALCAVPAVRAQDLAAVCRRVMHPPVGAWSQFNMVGGRGNGATWRMSIVGSETRRDTAYLWLEFAVRGMPTGMPGGAGDTLTIVTKVLVAGFGPGMSEPREHIMKFGSAPAMTMPVEQAGGPGAEGPSMMRDCTDGKVVGWESVTVPAGAFRALHVQNAEGRGDSWVVPDLPFGLVKAAMGGDADDSGQMVLVGHGTGAKSQITETPRPYDAQLLMQLMMGGASHR